MTRLSLLPGLLLLLLVALALRLHDISRAFWLDEAMSLWFARQPWGVLWGEVPRYEPHPPLYYSLLKLVLPLGEGEVALRLPSVLCSLAVLPLAWRILARMPDRAGRGFAGAGLLAALCLALAAPQIHFGQEARPYAALTLAATALLFFALRWLDDLGSGGAGLDDVGSGRARPATLVGLVLAGAATGWLHGIAGLYVAAVFLPLGVAALAHPARWRALGGLLLAAAAILLLLAPWLGALLARGGDWGQGSWMAPLTPYRARMVLLRLLQPLPVGDGRIGQGVLLAMLGLAAWGAMVLLRRAGWQRALLLAAAAGVPVLGALVISVAGAPVLAVRTLLPAMVPVLLLVAAGLWSGLPGLLRLPAAAVLVLLFGLGAGLGYPERRDEPYDALARVLATADPAEPVLVVLTDAAIPLALYLDRAGAARPLLPLPAPYPALGLPNRYPYGSPALPEVAAADIARALAATADAPAVWLVERDDAVPALRAGLAAARAMERDEAFGPALRLTRFGPPRPP